MESRWRKPLRANLYDKRVSWLCWIHQHHNIAFARRAIEEIIKENMAPCFLLFIACLLSARVQLCSVSLLGDPFHHFNKLFFAHAGSYSQQKGVGSRGSGSLKTWFDFKVRFSSLSPITSITQNHSPCSPSLSALFAFAVHKNILNYFSIFLFFFFKKKEMIH